GAIDQPVDQLGPLGRVTIPEEGAGLGGLGEPADGVEGGPSGGRRTVGPGGGGGPGSPQLWPGGPVDSRGGGRPRAPDGARPRGPDEAGPVGGERQPADRAPVAITDGDRRLPRSADVDQAVGGDLGPGGIAQVVGGLRRDVPAGTVLELGRDDQLLIGRAGS